MTRFNQKQPIKRTTPIVSTPSPVARTGNQAPGFIRDPRSELFLLAAGNFVGMDTFYEKADTRDLRYVELIHVAAQQDPDWTSRFLVWLRSEANMRTAAIIGAVELAKTLRGVKRYDSKPWEPGLGRKTVAAVLQRADEPGEALGYWMSTYPGKQIPKPIKRGIADAAARMYSEWTTLKYDTASHGIRFGDVLELTHAAPIGMDQSVLFKHLIDRRHGREGIPSSLTMLHMNAKLRELWALGNAMGAHRFNFTPEDLSAAGMTWEDVLSLAGNKVNKGILWESMIPNMGYMALLKNLRNFDEAGIGALSAQYVQQRLSDPDQVARSRQLPMRFLSAYRNVPSLRWGHALEEALNLSLRNVPEFPGRTLVLVDQSPSMFPGYHFSTKGSSKSEISLADQAKIFGSALALRAEKADLVQYGGTWSTVRFGKADSLLKVLERFNMIDSTDTEGAVRGNYNKHDRVIIVTDEQANYHGYRDVAASVPPNIPVITFNLAGYKVGHMESGSDTRITIGSLGDVCFKMLPILEGRSKGLWPWELAQ